MYEKGDKLIHTRHGTDHSFEEVYYITEIWVNKVGLAKRIPAGERCVIFRDVLDSQLASEYSQFRIVKQKKPYNMEEELFTL